MPTKLVNGTLRHEDSKWDAVKGDQTAILMRYGRLGCNPPPKWEWFTYGAVKGERGELRGMYPSKDAAYRAAIAAGWSITAEQ